MRILIQYITLAAMGLWFMMLMMSPMAFDDSSNLNNRNAVITLIVVLYYPVVIFGGYWLFGSTFLTIKGRTWTIVSLVIVTAALGTFGYFRLLSNSLRGIKSHGYTVTAERVYYNGKVIEGADPKTFVGVGDTSELQKHNVKVTLDRFEYTKDKAHVFYNGKALPDADVQSFEQVQTISADGERRWGDYYADSKSVFVYGERLEGSAKGTVKKLGSYYFANNGHVYYGRGSLAKDADAESFEVLSDSIGRDASHVYNSGVSITDKVDLATFRVLDEGESQYAVDERSVYHLPYQSIAPIEQADPKSFVVLDRGYSKDQSHVFYSDYKGNLRQTPRILSEADATTFEVTDYDDKTRSEARDAKHRFMHGKIVSRRSGE